MVRSTHKKAVVALNRLKDVLKDRDFHVLLMRAGVGRDPMTLQAIADQYGLTRQRVEHILNKIKRKTEAWDILVAEYPTLSGRIPNEKITRASKTVIRKACAAATEDEQFQYAALHRASKVPIPEHRKTVAELLSWSDSLLALSVDYGCMEFGPKWKICGRCGEIKTRSDFYSKGQGKLAYLCKPCNTRRCREYQREMRKKELEGDSVGIPEQRQTQPE